MKKWCEYCIEHGKAMQLTPEEVVVATYVMHKTAANTLKEQLQKACKANDN